MVDDEYHEAMAREAERIANEYEEANRGLGGGGKGLIQGKSGPQRCLANVVHVLGNHPDWVGVIARDRFREITLKLKPPPTRVGDGTSSPGEWSDVDTVRTVAWFTSEIGFEPTIQWVDSAVETTAELHAYHPVRTYLEGLEWDGKERLAGFLTTYFGAAQDDYTSGVGMKWMVSAVARILEPGCQADSMLVLEGKQGKGKSTGLEALFGQGWFADTGLILGDKDSYQGLKGKWLYEFGELDAFKGRDVTRIKAFLSARSDYYRPSYSRRPKDFPRQCIFAGSTNEEEYLADKTGNRRFWPVKTGEINVGAIREDRSQLWAEAVHLYKSGTKWHVDSEDLLALVQEQQGSREITDDWETIVRKWLDDPLKLRDRQKEGVGTADVLISALSMQGKDLSNRSHSVHAGQVLRRLGWFPRPVKRNGVTCRLYFQADNLEPEQSDLF